ncbi:MAG TPA: patatin, partial [Porticoccaceae bacterium]|nr:patatin [Porticoccaceae bacterium]
PLSPALHLGADKLFIVGVSDNPQHVEAIEKDPHPPSVGQMLSQLLNSAFIDSIESDLETLQSINNLTREIPEQAAAHNLRFIDHICISPSEPIDQIAEVYAHLLPRSMRIFLRAIGASAKGGGASAASYLLFEPEFCQALLDLGYRDALRQEDRILSFFGLLPA